MALLRGAVTVYLAAPCAAAAAAAAVSSCIVKINPKDCRGFSFESLFKSLFHTEFSERRRLNLSLFSFFWCSLSLIKLLLLRVVC